MLDMCRSIISLSKIANQIWRDQPFSQRYKTTERAVGGRGGGWGGGWGSVDCWRRKRKEGRGGWTKFENREIFEWLLGWFSNV